MEALAYATTTMTGILIGVGIMDTMEESENSSGSISIEQVDSTESQSTTVNISSCSEKEKRKRCKKWGVGAPAQASNIVNINRRGPKGIKRIDRPEESVPGSQYHAHVYNDAVLNVDGIRHDKHHGVPPFGKDDRDFLFCYGRKGV